MTPAGGQAVAIAPSEEVVLDAAAAPAVQSFVAPQLDDWDNWNYAAPTSSLDSASSRYVGPTVYGVDDLDHYGNWRVVQNYGSVWVPDAAPDRLGAVQHGPLGRRSVLRLDVGRHRTVGLGSVPLWPLGLRG